MAPGFFSRQRRKEKGEEAKRASHLHGTTALKVVKMLFSFVIVTAIAVATATITAIATSCYNMALKLL